MNIQYGYCYCGCGGKTTISPQTLVRKGYTKGEPRKFLPGHNLLDGPQLSKEERFWKNVDIKSQDDCWEWKITRSEDGYGTFSADKKTKKAHRMAWELTNGPIPHGLLVCHKCDNPPCCNPSHLFLGTNQDNMDDMCRKGRCTRAKGEKNAGAKLTWEQVREIRKIGKSMTQKEIAKIFGVKHCAISKILRNEYWIEEPVSRVLQVMR